jgi:cysteine desulfurase
MMRVYLDYNATAPLRPEARAIMKATFGSVGNASSVHAEGRHARGLIEAARTEVAGLVGADPRRVTFTSGGTEANNTVLTPVWTLNGKPDPIDVLLTAATEHVSVLEGGGFAADQIKQIPVDAEGVLDLTVLKQRLAELAGTEARLMVSVMLANNETGAIQPVAEIARLAHAAGALVHTDAVQAAGRIPIDIAALGVDVLTLSAHKIGGPQGAGAIVRAGDSRSFAPLTVGGGQEKRLRAGTENVAAIAGFGAAAGAAMADLGKSAVWSRWRDGIAAIVAGDREVSGKAIIFSQGADRLPQTLCFAVPGLSAETQLIALDLAGVAVSSGSACSSGKVSASHVLAAMGVPASLARCAIRVSLGWDSAESDLDSFATAWRSVLDHVAPGEIQAA